MTFTAILPVSGTVNGRLSVAYRLARGGRIDVHECDRPLVLGDRGRWRITGDDLAEDAVGFSFHPVHRTRQADTASGPYLSPTRTIGHRPPVTTLDDPIGIISL
jgi:hypothetical protein